MDKNQVIGITMLVLMFWVYVEFFAPQPPPPEEVLSEQPAVKEQSGSTSQQEVYQPIQLSNSEIEAQNAAQFGAFAQAASGKEKDIVIENNALRVTFSTLGGSLSEVLLKDHKTYTGEPLILSDKGNLKISKLISSQGKIIDLNELYFSSSSRSVQVAVGDTTQVIFRLEFDSYRYVEQVYTIGGTGFEIGYKLNFVGLDNLIDNQDLRLVWLNHAKRLEANLADARTRTTVQYYTLGEDLNDLSSSSPDVLSEISNEGIRWASLKQKFFTSAIIAENGFRSGEFSSYYNPLDSVIVREATLTLTYPIGDIKTGEGNFSFFFGPNNYQVLKKVTDGFAENVDLGWKMFAFINKFLVVPLFNWLENYISNYGIIIMILVIIIKIILFPLSYKAYMSMAKTKVFKPELDEIKAKYPDDAQKAQAEQMSMYQKAGINPLSGCIPMVLQMPILLALFYFFPNSIELRQKSFLWAHDLSTYDSILDLPFNIPMYGDHISLFTILMTASTVLYTWSNSQMTTVQGPMKTMQYMMPVMFMVFLNSYSSGLTFYYFVANIVTFVQQAIIRRFVDEDKIRKVIEENKKKNANKKSSPFMSRIQDAMKAGEEQRRQQKKK
ncbi:MAG: membrane protein insertase YidC [Bacteroidetes bacterium]|nr:membrane protein insertase YidC [Bacteroidota bacterium]MDA1120275.1 membrane protein insertase YidC [Bacteroidota bacterium]